MKLQNITYPQFKLTLLKFIIGVSLIAALTLSGGWLLGTTVLATSTTEEIAAVSRVARSSPVTVTLDGTAFDDGWPNPPAELTTTWTKVSGPGIVSFANASALDTTATFSEVGTYVLRLTADDSELVETDEVNITINPAPVAATVSKVVLTVKKKGRDYQALAEVYSQEGTLIAADFYLTDFLNSDTATVGRRGYARLESHRVRRGQDTDVFTIKITNPRSGVLECSVSVAARIKTCMNYPLVQRAGGSTIGNTAGL